MVKVHCEDWREGLRYFLDEKNLAKMKRLGLHVERLDWRNKVAHIRVNDEDMLRSLRAMESLSTR